jgi:hypothetical protein
MIAHRCTRTQYAPQCWCCQLAAPSRYGLTDEELWREAKRLVGAGWSLDEVRAVLQLPETIR